MSTAGILLFLNNTCGEKGRKQIEHHLNQNGRVSDEVLQLYWVKPTREDVAMLCHALRHDSWLAKHVEALDRLRPNNALRDLTAPWRLPDRVIENYMLLVGLETVNPAFKKKYPIPNLTLQAGSIENGETPAEGALREMHEEANVVVDKCIARARPIKLLRGGMWMYPCYINHMSQCRLQNKKLYLRPDWPDDTALVRGRPLQTVARLETTTRPLLSNLTNGSVG